MKDIVITSSVLILAILGIRYLLKEKISPVLQYSLWLVVVLRLLLPVPLWHNQFSILNYLPGSVEKSAAEDFFSGTPLRQAQDEQSGQDGINNKESSHVGKEDIGSKNNAAGNGRSDTIELLWAEVLHYLPLVWVAGIVISAFYIIFYQIKWKRYLRANRRALKGREKYKTLSVYTLKGLPSPCLSGRGIYLTKQMASDERQLAHILAHEYCHYRHLDSLWIGIRCVLLCVYWFHPLVWVAAYASKQDGELACDAAVLKLLGEEERLAYGKTLLRLISDDACGWNKVGLVSTMSGKEKSIRERIFFIAKKRKCIAAAAAVVVVMAAGLVALTFSGASSEQEADGFSEETGEHFAASQEIERQMQAQKEELVKLEEQLKQEIALKEASFKELQEQSAKQFEITDAVAEDTVFYKNPCPAASRISDVFGERVHPVTGETRVHDGVDFAAEKGTDILAAADGAVSETGFDAVNGNYITLYHSANGEYTTYRHCDEILATQGESVSQGQRIATVGSTGQSTGYHLHFGVMRDGGYVEPEFQNQSFSE